MQLGFYFDQTRCTGCCTCVVACKDWHDVPAGPASWRRVITIEEGDFPNLFVAFLTTSCCHCDQPACISVCPVQAIYKGEGQVLIDYKRCINCGKPLPPNSKFCLECGEENPGQKQPVKLLKKRPKRLSKNPLPPLKRKPASKNVR